MTSTPETSGKAVDSDTPCTPTDGSPSLPEKSAFDVNEPAGEATKNLGTTDVDPGRPGSSTLPEDSAFNVNGPAKDSDD